MPIFLASLIGALIQFATTLAGRVIVGLGISFVTYTGYSSLLDWIKQTAISSISSLPTLAFQIAGVLQVGTCVSILASAITARFVINGLSGGSITKMVQGKTKL